jgi:FlaA1/EpsC-like NDP-sugar epimerase
VNSLNIPASKKSILITGAGGFIGSALALAIAESQPSALVLLDHSEQNLYQIDLALSSRHNATNSGVTRHVAILGDVSDDDLLDEVLEKYRPDAIYHSAAYKHVPLMEANPVAVIANNVLGTLSLAEAALRHGTERLIMISTDKVVNPRSVMGVSKRVAELILMRFSNRRTRMSALRLGNVLGSSGSVLPLFERQISEGGPLTVTHPDACRYFISIQETVQLILAAGVLGEDGALLVPELGKPVKILDLAKRLIREAQGNTHAEIEIVFTGLRPGDKLTEELTSNSETFESTSDARLRRVIPASPMDITDSMLEGIVEGVRARNLAALVELLSAIVPEYQPSELMLELLLDHKTSVLPSYPHSQLLSEEA